MRIIRQFNTHLFLLSTVALFFLGAGDSAFAVKRTLAISEPVYKEMQKAQNLAGEKHYDKAETVLNKLFDRKLNEYEEAQTYSILGSLSFQQGNYDKAYSLFKHVVDNKNIPDGLKQLTLKTLAQLALVTDDYDAALVYLADVQSMLEKPDSRVLVLISQAHLGKEDYSSALGPLLEAIAIERTAGVKISESWLLTLNSIYFSLERYPDMLNVLEELVREYPQKKYIVNLAAIHGQLGNTKKQLLLLEPLYEKGEIDNETLLLNVANLYVLHGTPIKSATLLQKALQDGLIKETQRNYEMLAQSWQLAQEVNAAVAPLQSAGKLSEDGKVHLRLAQIHMFLYQWKSAEEALQEALRKGDIEDKGNALLLLGMTQFHQKKYPSALVTLTSAAEFEETKKLADQWYAYVDSEKEKAALLD